MEDTLLQTYLSSTKTVLGQIYVISINNPMNISPKHFSFQGYKQKNLLLFN